MIIENRGQLRILIPNEGNVLFKKSGNGAICKL